MALTLTTRQLAFLSRLSEYEYPRESCAILLGRRSGEVNAAIRCANVHPDPLHHYAISPSELIRPQRVARSFGLQIVGFYHSHPEHEAMWSESDLAEANWPGCVYLITSVRAGRAGETRAFRLQGDEERKSFAEMLVAFRS